MGGLDVKLRCGGVIILSARESYGQGEPCRSVICVVYIIVLCCHTFLYVPNFVYVMLGSFRIILS